VETDRAGAINGAGPFFMSRNDNARPLMAGLVSPLTRAHAHARVYLVTIN